MGLLNCVLLCFKMLFHASEGWLLLQKVKKIVGLSLLLLFLEVCVDYCR